MEDQHESNDDQYSYIPPPRLNPPSPYHVDDIENPSDSNCFNIQYKISKVKADISDSGEVVEDSSENTEINPYYAKNDIENPGQTSKEEVNDMSQDFSVFEEKHPIYMQETVIPQRIIIPFYCQPPSPRSSSVGSEEMKITSSQICLMCLASVFFAPAGLYFLCKYKRNKKVFVPLKPCVEVGIGILIILIFVMISWRNVFRVRKK